MASVPGDVHEALLVIEEHLTDLEVALDAERVEAERLRGVVSSLRARLGAPLDPAERILGRDPYLEPEPTRTAVGPASTNAELRARLRSVELDRDGWRARAGALETQIRNGDAPAAPDSPTQVQLAEVRELVRELAHTPSSDPELARRRIAELYSRLEALA